MTGNQDTIYTIEPQDAPFPDKVRLIENLQGHWWANKAYFYNPMNFKSLGNTSHKIYLTYDTPLFNSVNVIALDKACYYADGLDNTSEIAEYIVGGTNAEGWTYDTNKEIFSDPLDVILL
jgi:hypothetical protein